MNILPENANIKDILLSLYGISNVNVYIPDNNLEPIRIFFNVDKNTQDGLFLITRCADKRYWVYGHLWKIELSVGDYIRDNGNLPITYMFHSNEITRPEADDQLLDFIENVNHHLNHPTFCDYYGIDKKSIKNKYISNIRKNKLKKYGY